MNDFNQRYIAARRRVIAGDLRQLNDAQRQAAMTTEGPLLLLAGAGSGKTTVLIQRVYNLLTYGRGSDCDVVPDGAAEEDLAFLESFPENPSPQEEDRARRLCAVDVPKPWEIIAITFTNKATEEMKRRIIDELDALASLPAPDEEDASYAEKLCAEFGCSRSELAETARSSLRQLLFDYHYFNISTIDSFFQRVLRTFARELDRQGDFSVELNDNYAIRMSVADMLDQFNFDANLASPLGRWIESFMDEKIARGERANFFNRNSDVHLSLIENISHICEEPFKVHRGKMREYLADPSSAPLTEKLSPEAVEMLFACSKKDFKKAVGHLYRDRKIEIAPDGVISAVSPK